MLWEVRGTEKPNSAESLTCHAGRQPPDLSLLKEYRPLFSAASVHVNSVCHVIITISTWREGVREGLRTSVPCSAYSGLRTLVRAQHTVGYVLKYRAQHMVGYVL